MNKYDIAKSKMLEAIKELDIEELAKLVDELDYILQTKCNNGGD